MQSLARNFVRNLSEGLRLALGFPQRGAGFIVSWNALWFIFALTCIMTAAVDYAYTAAPRIFSPEGFGESAAFLVVMLAASWLAGFLLGERDKILAVTIAVYNGMVLPYLVLIAAYAVPVLQTDAKGNWQRDIWGLYWIWLGLIAFGAISRSFASKPLRILLAAALVGGGHIYVSQHIEEEYWYSSREPEQETARLNVEDVLQSQHDLLQEHLTKLRPSRSGPQRMYGVIFGSDSFQDVFMKEAKFVDSVVTKKFDLTGRTVALINNAKTIHDDPMATTYNLSETLNYIGSISRKDTDILFLYLTSHGGAESGLQVQMNDVGGLRQLDARRLAALLDASGMRNRVIIISSCYSGAMIDDLKTPYSLIITAAAKDKTSFGCADDADLTYFADAYVKQALGATDDFIAAFERARAIVTARENKENIEHSYPQIFVGDKIPPILEKYKGSLTAHDH